MIKRIVPRSPQPVAPQSGADTLDTVQPEAVVSPTASQPLNLPSSPVLNQPISAMRRRFSNTSALIQSAIFLAVGIGIIIFDIFVLAPGLIRVSIAMKGIGQESKGDTLPPRVPVFSAPPEATNSAQISLTGFGESETEIYLVQNGTAAGNTRADSEGAFRFEINLEEGENALAMYARDENGNESSLSREVSIEFDQKPPELVWDKPEDNAVIRNLREQQVTVSGQVSEQSTVYLNDRIISVNSDGKFEASFQLQQGDNEVTLKAIDRAGNSVEQKRTVSFRP